MGGAFRYPFGKVAELLALPTEQWAALEADLLHAGFVLGDFPRRLNLRALHAFCEHARPDSALFRVINGPSRPTLTDEVLRMVLLAAQQANWQRGSGKGDQPKLLVWPGDEDEDASTSHMGDPMLPSDFHAMYPNA